MIKNQASSESRKLSIQLDRSAAINPVKMVNFPNESIPYLPAINRISLSFICLNLLKSEMEEAISIISFIIR